MRGIVLCGNEATTARTNPSCRSNGASRASVRQRSHAVASLQPGLIFVHPNDPLGFHVDTPVHSTTEMSLHLPTHSEINGF